MPVETLEEWIDRHGGRKAMLRLKEWTWLFPTGARLVNEPTGVMGPRLFEPPGHPEHRLEARREYWQTRLERAENAFHSLKVAITPPSSPDYIPVEPYRWDEREFGPAPSRDGADCLRWLRDRVKEFRRAVADLDRQYALLPSVVAKRERLRAEMARDREIDAMMSARRVAEAEALKAITIDD